MIQVVRGGLTPKQVDEVATINSREVAQMMEIKHWEVLRKIEGSKDRKGYIEILTNNQMVASDYFIESYYKDESGKLNTCYEITKMGCEFLANKFTGEKGVLFTAKYVQRFNEMERQFKPKSQLEVLQLAVNQMVEQNKVLTEHEQRLDEVETKVEEQITLKSGEQRGFQKAVSKKVYEFADCKEEASVLFKELYRDVKDRFGVPSYKDIRRNDLQAALNYVNNWLPKRN